MIDIDWDVLSENHRIIGLIGISLLLIYLILTAVFTPFRGVFFRGMYMLLGFMKNATMAFALIPLYLNWISTDYFQERRRTSYGNAVTNGFMGIWVGLEWIRTSYVAYQTTPDTTLLIGKLIISALILIYAAFIIKESVAGRKIAHIIGRVREISFFAILITPLIYDVVPLDILTILAIILLLPMFYGVVEFIEYTVLPAPKAEKKRNE